MSKQVRTQAAKLAVEAARSLDGHVSAQEIFSLMIMFEYWILKGGDFVQERMKILDDDADAVSLRVVK